MNENQRKLLIAVAAVILGMLIHPPYRVYGRGSSSGSITETGYAFLIALPDYATVDVATLIAQWLGILLAGAIGYFVLKNK